MFPGFRRGPGEVLFIAFCADSNEIYTRENRNAGLFAVEHDTIHTINRLYLSINLFKESSALAIRFNSREFLFNFRFALPIDRRRKKAKRNKHHLRCLPF